MASVLVVDDELSFIEGVAEILRSQGHSVSTCDNLARAREMLASNARFDLLMVDLMLPDGNGIELLSELGERRPRHVVVITGHPGLKDTIQQLHGRGITYLTKPLEVQELTGIAARLDPDDGTAPTQRHFGLMVGDSAAMKNVYQKISYVAATDTAVLITGESGTGKELVAEAIHRESRRRGDLVTVNCGALSRELVASELFGHEKGSFTGAQRRHVGHFERAQDGTLFLDEITEMPVELQPQLLRALENSRIVRVGGEGETEITARLVAATNRDPATAIQEGHLREDLYFRISVFPIELPPLRTRREDIPAISAEALRELNEKYHASKTLSDSSIAQLMAHDWPGNVRELRHTIHRAFIQTPDLGGQLRLPEGFASYAPHALKDTVRPGRSIREVERELIDTTLSHFDGDKRKAAETLGISLKTLYNRLKEYEEEAAVADNHSQQWPR